MWSVELREFVNWYNNTFKVSGLWKAMEKITENSPFHRENSVAAHTDMVVMTLLGVQSTIPENQRERLLALFAAAFHDVGKPSMREEKYSEERGTYYAYSGHELRSARLWQNYYSMNKEMLRQKFFMTDIEFYQIAVMIEKHRPWGIKDRTKIESIFSSLDITLSQEYLNLLVADNAGRVTDDSDSLVESLCKVGAYEEILEEYPNKAYNAGQRKLNYIEQNRHKWGSDKPTPQLIMPIAQSGAGKSTAWNRVRSNDPVLNPHSAKFVLHSMDVVRAELYGDDTEVAFMESTKDKDFSKKVQADFIDKVRKREHIYVDNTNLSAKRRRFYITEARKHGYDCHALLFIMSLTEAINRSENRDNRKPIPKTSVIRQYNSLSMPMIDIEFDSITFVE